MQPMAERLASGVKIPLGKHLLGVVYRMLHQVLARLDINLPLSNIGGSWWFLQLWLNLYTHKVIGHEITQQEFPADYLESGTPKNRRCTNFGKSVSSMSVERLAPNKLADCFKFFEIGLADNTIVWFAYGRKADIKQFEEVWPLEHDL
jgi:hypothetical protein